MAYLEAKTAELGESASQRAAGRSSTSRARTPQKIIVPHKAEPKPTKANAALLPQVAASDAFRNPALKKAAFYADDNVLIFNMDVREAMAHLAKAGMIVNCMVTSPPFYGQRDYGVDGQIGLEEHPSEFIANLVDCFESCKPVLAENGSLWVNLGDTYWSGKGEHKSGEVKQSARRFGLRPQDKKGEAKGVSGFLCARRDETFPRCWLPKVPLDRRRAARWESRWSF